MSGDKQHPPDWVYDLVDLMCVQFEAIERQFKCSCQCTYYDGQIAEILQRLDSIEASLPRE